MKTANITEEQIHGRGVGSGIGMGTAVLIDTHSAEVEPNSISTEAVKVHKRKFIQANKTLIGELEIMAGDLNDSGSKEIIEAQLQIIKDPEIEKNVSGIIEEKLLSVEYAIYRTYSKFIERLKESGSELFKQRIVDLEDIRDRLVAIVCNHTHKHPVKKGDVVVAKDLSPTELVSFHEHGVAGLVMERGGPTSHAAIIAKSLGLPSVVSAEHATKKIKTGDKLIIDSTAGAITLHPVDGTVAHYKKLQKEREKRLSKICKDVFETKDGFPFQLMANIEFEAELPKVKEYSARGIGLLRTEGLLFGSRIRKGREEQEVFYENILSGSEGIVTIRLFDVGGDKGVTRANKESNPFLGWRGVRLLLDEKQLLHNQLKAILKVSGKYPGRVRILVPMVSTMREVESIKKELDQAKKEMLAEGCSFDDDIKLGLMVEVPSVAVATRNFAKEVDFLSVGTNDLTQYTLAVDRGNERICELFQHYHPSVLHLIKMVYDGAQHEEVGLSVCGELAGDPVGAAFLIGLGINELSMLPHSIPEISDLLTSYSKSDFEKFSTAALNSTNADEVKNLFEQYFS